MASNLSDAVMTLAPVSEKCNDQRTAEIKFVLHYNIEMKDLLMDWRRRKKEMKS